ncbi:uncharacterized protein LOC132646828 isoform X2 [Meriones unguiculatus]|uniref:uncharacterized protein LOC132646828 isoform X2 n=1 Tax=Meriones unguiculatus TaxID=10047 RepID=UPI00293EABF5|nr:uncharacterized protein LOC132646828 isoform X2 [Meriones unguiculatus]
MRTSTNHDRRTSTRSTNHDHDPTDEHQVHEPRPRRRGLPRRPRRRCKKRRCKNDVTEEVEGTGRPNSEPEERAHASRQQRALESGAERNRAGSRQAGSTPGGIRSPPLAARWAHSADRSRPEDTFWKTHLGASEGSECLNLGTRRRSCLSAIRRRRVCRPPPARPPVLTAASGPP